MGRISKAARLADSFEQEMDRDNDSRISGQITREQASSVMEDLFPQGNENDVINAEGEGVIPLRLTAADVNSAILGLNIEKTTGFSGWSNRLLKNLYLHADDRGQFAENYAAFFNKQLKGELSAHMRKYLAPVRLCLIPKTKNPSDLKFRPIGIGETLFRLLGRALLSRVGKEIGNQITSL